MTKKIECPNGHPAPDWASPGDTVTCPYCSTRYTVEAASEAPKFVISAGGAVSIGGDVVTEGDKIVNEVHNYAPGATSPAPVELPVAPVSGGFVCSKCHSPAVVKKVKPGKKHLCMVCGTFSQMSADGTRLELAEMLSGDVGGEGKPVNIKTEGDFGAEGDVTGRLKK